MIATILIASILTFPLPTVQAQATDLIDAISPTTGPIGVTVTVNGTAPTAINETFPVKLYWCTSVPPDPDTDKLLATVESPVEGTTKVYEVDVTVPYVASNGTYNIAAWQDTDNDTAVDANEWDNATFTVVEKPTTEALSIEVSKLKAYQQRLEYKQQYTEPSSSHS